MASRVSRLPGIRFETPPPALDEVLPRMDIALFVGFAASGPVRVPVAIESADAFERIFGTDAPLAWDAGRGETLRAQLAPAVRAFFRGGGTRCWVVRVANNATPNVFPLAGMLRRTGQQFAPAFGRSRAAGRWSDATRVATALMPRPLEVHRLVPQAGQAVIEVAVNREDDVLLGDILRFELGTEYVLFVAIESRTRIEVSPPTDRMHLQLAGPASWFTTVTPVVDPNAAATLVAYTALREPANDSEDFAAGPAPILNAVSDWMGGNGGSLELEVQLPLENAPEPGMLVAATVDNHQMWMTVDAVGVRGRDGAAHERLRISGRGLWFLNAAPLVLPAVQRGEQLSLELWVVDDSNQPHRLGDLGLAPSHPQFWANLPTDDERYRDESQRADVELFPLSGAARASVFLPIGVAVAPNWWLGAMRQPRTSLERDGLAAFTPDLFLDADLVEQHASSIADRATQLAYLRPAGVGLSGIHAAFSIDEATILAVPDATQPGWDQTIPQSPPAPDPSAPVAQPAWGTFLDCAIQLVAAPQWSSFFQSAPSFQFDTGTFTLEWQGPADASFVLEEAHASTWQDSAVVYEGPLSRLDVYGRLRGSYYYRVRAVVRGRTSDWSPGLTIVVGGLERWIARDDRSYVADALIAVQRGMLRAAAGRGDLFAILGLPAHYREHDITEHLRVLKDGTAAPIPVQARGRMVFSLALNAAETGAFSFGALYHPWVIVREHPADEVLTLMPPDGLAAGLLARRTLARGAWIAPGNEPLPGVLALTPPLATESRVDLLDDGLNLIVQEPRGFVPIAASTLSDNPDFQLINVRRLLSLLRRLAVREGATYVFEPHSDTFRRSVQRGFESLLTRMFERGAFAGATASTAFQVITSESVNTFESMDLGRFIVELRVAPSLPMTFLTVRLIQTGDRTLVVEER